jgi:hypothetical protein
MKMLSMRRSVAATLSIASAFGSAALLLTACKDVTKPDEVDEQENFSTLILSLTNAADASDKMSDTLKFAVSYSAGTTLSKNQTVKLKAGATYDVETVLLDETKTPAVDMSEDVSTDSDIHQLFYTPAGADLAVTYEDKDANNHPIGLKLSIKAGAAGSGTLKVTLKHQVEGTSKLKPAIDWTAHPQGDITVGETDVEGTFNVTIQ